MIKKVNWLWVSLIFCSILLAIPYLDSQFIPAHDTMYQFTLFHFFYSEWFFNHDMASWLPYSNYGVPALFYQLQVFSPAEYLFFFFGKVFHVTDVLLLFKLSIIFAQIVFLYGMYKLSNILYEHPWTPFIVCFAAIASVVWYSNLHVAFRYYYLFPWVAYYIVTFFIRHDPSYIWKALLIVLVWWVMGSSPYHAIIWGITLLMVFAILALQNPNVWKSIFDASQRTRPYIFFVLLSAVVILGAYKLSISGLTIESPGRDPQTGKTSLDVFLSYGGQLSISQIFSNLASQEEIFLRKIGSGWDAPIYMGLLTLIFGLTSIICVRKKILYVFLIPLFFLMMFSLGGDLATFLYSLPGVSYYRHLPFIMEMAKILLLICSGFGIDYFLKLSKKDKIPFVLCVLFAVAFVLDCSIDFKMIFVKNWVQALEFIVPRGERFSQIYYSTLMILIVLLMTFCSVLAGLRVFNQNKNQPTLWPIFLCLFMMFDMLAFQARAYNVSPRIPESFSMWNAFQVKKPEYAPKRFMQPQTEEQKQIDQLLTSVPRAATYSASYNFVHMDFCKMKYKNDILTSGVHNVLQDPGYENTWVGCETAKFRWAEEKRELENITVTSFTANHIDLEIPIVTSKSKTLIYADAFHPAWEARIDGQPVKITVMDKAFKSVAIPAGKHQLSLIFSPIYQIVSWLLMGVGLIACLIFCRILIRDLFAPSLLK